MSQCECVTRQMVRLMKRFLLTLGFIAAASLAHGQATVTMRNNTLTRVQLFDAQTGTTVPVPTSISLNYGLFVNGSATPVMPLATSSTTVAGIIDAPQPYAITGVTPHQEIPAQVRGWAAEFGTDWQAAKTLGAVYGETEVRVIVPDDPMAPGAIIWQPRNGTHPNRFYPLVVSGGGISIGDITVAEGSNGVVNAVFTVSLSGPREQTVTVDFATQDGSAVAGQDYVGTNGTVTFTPGQTSHTITVTVTADAPTENDEQFSIVLSNPVNSAIRRGTGTCLITEASISELRIDTAIVFHTVAGRHYAVERSTDLVTWTTVQGAEDVPGLGGSMTVYDKGVGCSGVRYYRTRLLTP